MNKSMKLFLDKNLTNDFIFQKRERNETLFIDFGSFFYYNDVLFYSNGILYSSTRQDES